jgi:hypothetical protein
MLAAQAAQQRQQQEQQQQLQQLERRRLDLDSIPILQLPGRQKQQQEQQPQPELERPAVDWRQVVEHVRRTGQTVTGQQMLTDKFRCVNV